MYTLPNLLTLVRILLIPLIVILFWMEGDDGRWITLAVFVTACLTDFFDGRLARRCGQETKLGRLLDPIADKLLVGSMLLVLCAFGRITGPAIVAAVIILCREFAVSGLREFLAGDRVEVPVSRAAKWKTTIQLIALGFLIVGSAAPAWIPAVAIGEAALWVATLLAVTSAYEYFNAGMRHVSGEQRRIAFKGSRARTKQASCSENAFPL